MKWITRVWNLHLIPALVIIVCAACAAPQSPVETASEAPLDTALQTIQGADMLAAIKSLSSDEFEGRGPSSRGEEKTINYLRDEFIRIGLQPGNGESFVQEVPLVALTADPAISLTIEGGSGTSTFRYGGEFMAWSKRVVEQSSLVGSDMVFMGYGAVAPEYDWNDYAGIDVKGKTVVILVNDPGFATQDESLFNGNAMTYYGRWTYKFEEAARQGAAGVFIVHETEPAAYPWAVVEGSWRGEQFGLVPEDNNMSRAAIEGWITVDTARSIFKQAGLDYDGLRDQAAKKGFKPVPMGLNASASVTNTIRRSTSNNIFALLPGTERPDEFVFYMAHWDHLGRDTTLDGDQIYNGAFDNATGTANLLELAEAFVSLDEGPARSIVFFATTAEEQGLLGSAFYAETPIYPPEKTVAAINMDGANIWGKMRDITVVGFGMSELDDYLKDAAVAQGREVRPDPEPQKGFYYRSDHFELAKKGIPALYTDSGIDHVEHGEEWGLAQRDTYTSERYHKPNDEFDPNWDMSGAVDDVRLFFRVGYRLANESRFPNWREGTKFKAVRDSTMASLR
jgi:Zn-dependent M28 family amino/carboxypeptidase